MPLKYLKLENLSKIIQPKDSLQLLTTEFKGNIKYSNFYWYLICKPFLRYFPLMHCYNKPYENTPKLHCISKASKWHVIILLYLWICTALVLQWPYAIQKIFKLTNRFKENFRNIANEISKKILIINILIFHELNFFHVINIDLFTYSV